jgi:hypothetical protein
VDIVEAEELPGALEAAMSGRLRSGRLRGAQATPPMGLSSQGPTRRTRLPPPPSAVWALAEPADAFFLRSKSGSREVFQVRIRRAVSPSAPQPTHR